MNGFGFYTGVSRPPTIWHSGPGVEPTAGSHVWWVATEAWPDYTVRTGRFSVMIAACHPNRVARVLTESGTYEEVPFARLFVSKQDAEAEAIILREFALEIAQSSDDKCAQVINVSSRRRG